MIKTVLMLFCSLYLTAYEIPEFTPLVEGKPEIVIFDTQSVVVNKKPSYKIRWKTINATDVNITFIGKVALSGSLTITEDEYNRGAITLTASSKTTTFIDRKTINKNAKSKVITPVLQGEDSNDFDDSTYIPRTFHRPGLRRRVY
jgi:hypothetical protein